MAELRLWACAFARDKTKNARNAACAASVLHQIRRKRGETPDASMGFPVLNDTPQSTNTRMQPRDGQPPSRAKTPRGCQNLRPVPRTKRSLRPQHHVVPPYLGRADGLAQLARNAALLPAGVPPEGVLSAESRAERSLLERVVDSHLGLEEHLVAARTRVWMYVCMYGDGQLRENCLV